MTSKAKRNTNQFNSKMVNFGINMYKQSWRITALIDEEAHFMGAIAERNTILSINSP